MSEPQIDADFSDSTDFVDVTHNSTAVRWRSK
jgi:hypothetical protein